MFITRLGLAGALCVTGLAAGAATLDFTELTESGLIATTEIELSNATLTSFGSGFFISAPGPFGGQSADSIVCSTPVGGFNCTGDMQIDFDFDIENLSFSSVGAAPGDSVEITAFLDGAEVTSTTVTTDGLIDLSAFGPVDSLLFEDGGSTAAGIAFNLFDFDAAGVIAPVPLPASGLILLASGLGALAWRRTQAAG